MSKDRAAPFSRKHRRYWIPVTGGMILIGVLNVGVGLCAYEPEPAAPERIIPVLPMATPVARTAGQLGLGEVPAVVMRAFAVAYPRHVPSARLVPGAPPLYELSFTTDAPDGSVTTRVTYRSDGTFVAVR